MKFKVLELFAGAGGLALGLEKAGFETIGLIEIDKNAANTLKKNRPQWNVINEDIVKVVNEGLEKYLDISKIDLVSGGFPCQSFSYAGKRLGLEDTRGTMFFYYADIIRQVMPKILLAENVKGLVRHDDGKTLKTIVNILEEIGYKIQWKVLNALDYGVAQKRERMVLIGIRRDIYQKEFDFPEKYNYQLVLRNILNNVPPSLGMSYPERKKRILDMVPPGGCWRDLPEETAKEYMKKSYYLGGGRTGMARRLSMDEPSLTLTCSPAQNQTERCHPSETRPFTVREYARIQSFPDEWDFVGSMHSMYKQIGNAVPVELAKNIGKSILSYLNQNNTGENKKC